MATYRSPVVKTLVTQRPVLMRAIAHHAIPLLTGNSWTPTYLIEKSGVTPPRVPRGRGLQPRVG